MDKRLTVIATEQNSWETSKSTSSQKKLRRQEMQKKFDALWQEDPSQFAPERNSMQKERLERTLDLILRHTTLEGKRVVDLGCGNGSLAIELAEAGALVDAVDISSHALKSINQKSHPNITTIQDLIPTTSLADDTYDLVISTEIIGHLSREERRLYFAELSRLVKSDGFVVSSTEIDINTEDGAQAFGALVETEFQPIEWVFSYHAYFIRMKHFFEIPELFSKGRRDRTFREQQLAKRAAFSKWWYGLNSSPVLGSLWSFIALISNPIVRYLTNSRFILINFEKICRTLSPDSGISHVLFIGRRRPLEIPTQEELMAIVPKQKRLVWE